MHTFLVIVLAITIKLAEANLGKRNCCSLNCLFIVVIVTLDLASFYRTYIPGDPLPDGIIILNGSSCTMHCPVQVNESLPTPQVSWLFGETGNTFVDMNDFDYWNARYKNYYCYSPSLYGWPNHFQDYSPRIESTCIEQFDNSSDEGKVYDCSLELKRCLRGTYKCVVSVGDREIPVNKSITYVISK